MATRSYPRDIKVGQQIRIPFLGTTSRRRWEWRTVILVEPKDQHTIAIHYLDADGSFDLNNRMCVARNSKHDVRG